MPVCQSLACDCPGVCSLANTVAGTVATVAVTNYSVLGPSNKFVGAVLEVSTTFTIEPMGAAPTIDMDADSGIILGPGSSLTATSPVSFQGQGRLTARPGSRVHFATTVKLDAALTMAASMTIATGANITGSAAVTVEDQVVRRREALVRGCMLWCVGVCRCVP